MHWFISMSPYLLHHWVLAPDRCWCYADNFVADRALVVLRKWASGCVYHPEVVRTATSVYARFVDAFERLEKSRYVGSLRPVCVQVCLCTCVFVRASVACMWRACDAHGSGQNEEVSPSEAQLLESASTLEAGEEAADSLTTQDQAQARGIVEAAAGAEVDNVWIVKPSHLSKGQGSQG